MLRDTAQRDTSVELFGRRLPAPLLLAPIGVLEMAHADADLAVARGGARRSACRWCSRPRRSVSMEDVRRGDG